MSRCPTRCPTTWSAPRCWPPAMTSGRPAPMRLNDQVSRPWPAPPSGTVSRPAPRRVPGERAGMPGADHDAFWRELLAGHPVTRLPRWAAAPRPGQARASIAVPGSAAALPGAPGEPAELLALAAFVRVIGMLTGEADIVIGYRARPGQPAVPLRVRLAGGSWRDLIAAVR